MNQTNNMNFTKVAMGHTTKDDEFFTRVSHKKRGQRIDLRDLGFKSRADEIKIRDNCDSRSDPDRLKKTKLCWSVLKGTHCPHGDKCQFAHSKDELRTSPCLFGERCRFVRFSGNMYENSTCERTCQYLHPHESRENYMHRTGIEKIEFKSKSSIEDIVPSQVIVNQEVTIEELAEMNEDTYEIKIEKEQDEVEEIKIEKEQDEVEDIKVEKEQDEVEEIKIEKTDGVSYTVPEEIALETFKAALEMGHTVINITII